MDDVAVSQWQARQLRRALRYHGSTAGDVWMDYARRGSSDGVLEVDAYLHESLHLFPAERDLLVRATQRAGGPPPRAAGADHRAAAVSQITPVTTGRKFLGRIRHREEVGKSGYGSMPGLVATMGWSNHRNSLRRLAWQIRR